MVKHQFLPALLPLLCTMLPAQAPSAAVGRPPAPPDISVRENEVLLGERAGWVASLVLDLGADTPLWTVASTKVLPQYGCDEVIGRDNRGQAHVLESYSGRWIPYTVIDDPAWLGAFAQGDVDARIPGPELYVAGKSGNVYQVVAHRQGVVDYRWLENIDGLEVHTLVAADVWPEHAGDELLAFTNPGALYVGVPHADRDGFAFEKVSDLPGRVRDAVLLPHAAGAPVEVAVA